MVGEDVLRGLPFYGLYWHSLPLPQNPPFRILSGILLSLKVSHTADHRYNQPKTQEPPLVSITRPVMAPLSVYWAYPYFLGAANTRQALPKGFLTRQCSWKLNAPATQASQSGLWLGHGRGTWRALGMRHSWRLQGDGRYQHQPWVSRVGGNNQVVQILSSWNQTNRQNLHFS